MIFSKPMIRAILLGQKTETRRLIQGDVRYVQPRTKTGQRRLRSTQSQVLSRPFTPVAGKSYAVQPGRGKDEEFRIRCTSVQRAELGTIDHDAAVREGFPAGVTAFARYWLSLHDKAWPRLEPVFCPTCLVDADYPADELPPCTTCGGSGELKIRPAPTDDEVLARFNGRWGAEMVWVIGFKLEENEKLRLLMEHRGGELRGDYTTSTQQGMAGGFHQDAEGRERAFPEPEALSGDDWERYVQHHSVMTSSQWVRLEQGKRDQERHRQSLEQRIETARRLARRSGDFRGDFRALDRMLLQQASPEALERQVQRIESKIDRQTRLVRGVEDRAA